MAEPRRKCKHNGEIICRRKGCEGCGWYPAELEKRRAQIREQEKKGEVLHVSVQRRNPAEL